MNTESTPPRTPFSFAPTEPFPFEVKGSEWKKHPTDNKAKTLLYPAKTDNGIHNYDKGEAEVYTEIFKQYSHQLSCAQFVCAADPGKTMLKNLIQFNREFRPQKETFGAFCNRTKNYELSLLFQNLKKFSFYPKLRNILSKRKTKQLTPDNKKLLIGEILLKNRQFEFLFLPKALLPLHKTAEKKCHSAFEEHIFQISDYADNFKKMEIRFETAEREQPLFDKTLVSFYQNHKKTVEKPNFRIGFCGAVTAENPFPSNNKNGVYDYGIDFCPFQNAEMNLLEPVLNSGAFHTSADIVHVSHLDNVAKPKIQKKVVGLKKLLSGKLIFLQKTAFKILSKLENHQLSDADIDYCLKWIKTEFFIDLHKFLNKASSEEKNEVLYQFLNRPFRVCAMVANTCRSGGGAFWTLAKNGAKTLQVVKMDEVDRSDGNQYRIFKKAAYFNPVELCYSLKNHKGKSFGQAYFSKNTDGCAQHRKPAPGLNLWNKGMAEKWNTVFIKTQPDYFCHIDSILDLLHSTHN